MAMSSRVLFLLMVIPFSRPLITQCPTVNLCVNTNLEAYPTTVGDVCHLGFLRSYVNLVSFASVVNDTTIPSPLCPPGFSGFSSFLNQTAIVVPCQTVLLTLGVFNNGLIGQARAYVDWNGNRYFDDAGERYDLNLVSVNQVVFFSASIRVPSNAVAETRIRVGFGHPGPPPPSGSFFGDIEEYTVRVTGGLLPSYQENKPEARLYVNGAIGSAYCLATVPGIGVATIMINSNDAQALHFVAVSFRPAVPNSPSLPGILVNFDVNDPLLFFTGGVAGLPVTYSGPASGLSAVTQCITFSPLFAMGIASSQATIIR